MFLFLYCCLYGNDSVKTVRFTFIKEKIPKKCLCIVEKDNSPVFFISYLQSLVYVTL